MMAGEPCGVSANRIKHLPLATCSSLRSSVILFGFTKVVEELVFNSLDAGATKVFVYVGVGSCSVKVADNGAGIARDGLDLIGERYVTSKIHNCDDKDDDASKIFGFRGESLCSISDISLLEIATRAQGRPNGYRKVIKGSRCLYLGIDGERQDLGTAVTVRDLFYNQPVRRRQMQDCPKKVLYSIKKCLLRIALVCTLVSFKLVDLESEDELLSVQPSSSPMPMLVNTFGFEVSSSLYKVCFSDGPLKLSGFVPHPWKTFSKGFQYVYINSRFVRKGPIHKLMHQLAESYCSFDGKKSKVGTRNTRNGRSQGALVYILNLQCPQSYYDITFEPLKPAVEFSDWIPILNFISEAIKRHWDTHLLERELPAQMVAASQRKDTKEEVNSNQYDLDLPFLTKEVLNEGIGIITQSDVTMLSLGTTFVDDGMVESRGNSVLFEGSGPLELTEGSGVMSHQNNSSNHEILFSDSETDFVEPEEPTQIGFSQPKNTLFLNGDTKMWNPQRMWNPQYETTCFPLENFDHSHQLVEINEYGTRPFIRDYSSRRKFSHSELLYGMDEELEDGMNSSTKRQRLDFDDAIDIAGPNSGTGMFSWEHSAIKFCPFSEMKPKLDTGLSSGENFGTLQFDRDMNITEEIHYSLDWSTSRNPETYMYGNEDVGRAIFKSKMFDEHVANRSCKSFNIQSVCSPIRSYKYPAIKNTSTEFNHTIDSNDNLDDFLPKRDPSSEDMHQQSRVLDVTESFTYYETDPCKNFSIRSVCSPNRSYKYLTTMNKPINLNNSIGSKGNLEDFLSKHDPSLEDVRKKSCVLYGTELFTYLEVDDGKRVSLTQQISVRNRHQKEKSRRCHSAPPIYRGKKLFFTLASCSRTNPVKAAAISAGISPSLSIHDSEKIKNTAKSANENCTNEGLAKPHELGAHTGIMLDEGERSPSVKWRHVPVTSDEEKSCSLHSLHDILDVTSGILHLSCDSLIPKTINKNCLADAKVLQQVDRKFIPIISSGMVAIIDQHAADERIRLEELRRKVLSDEMKTIAYLDSEQELIIPEIGFQLVMAYANQIKSWGWILNANHQQSKSFTKSLKLLHHQPTVIKLLAVPCILGVKLTDKDLLEYLQQLADTDGSSTMPPSVLRVLNFKACRGAIMFGDSLLHSECALIVDELKRTSLCFQCAHGRPTIAPLVNLDVLRREMGKLGLSNSSWHGLTKCSRSFDQAVQRLNIARGFPA